MRSRRPLSLRLALGAPTALVAGLLAAFFLLPFTPAEPLPAAESATAAEAMAPAGPDRIVAAPSARPEMSAPAVAAAPAAPPAKIDTTLDASAAVRGLFPDGAYLMETTGPHQPKTCDDLKDAVVWVRIRDGIRSEMERYQISPARFLVGLLTLGLSSFAGPNEPNRTIFSIRQDGRYLTFLLGAPRTDMGADKVGPVYRLTYYQLDQRRLGLVEAGPADAPAFKRPASGTPRVREVVRRCVYRSDESDEA